MAVKRPAGPPPQTTASAWDVFSENGVVVEVLVVESNVVTLDSAIFIGMRLMLLLVVVVVNDDASPNAWGDVIDSWLLLVISFLRRNGVVTVERKPETNPTTLLR